MAFRLLKHGFNKWFGLNAPRDRWLERSRLQVERLEDRTLLSSQPDLAVVNVVVSNEVAVAGNANSLTVTYTGKNLGDFAPIQAWTDGFYLSGKPTLDSSAQLLATKQRFASFPLAAGAAYTASVTLTIPNTALSGN